ncbi:MAG: DUF3267 domain-containing protein [Candidatus Bathyarchaeota archaeon]
MVESLPEGYVEKAVIDLTSERRLKFSAVLLGLVLIVAVSVAMAWYVDVVRPGVLDLGLAEDQEGGIIISFDLGSMLSYLAVLVLVLVLHELVHGVVFWRVSGVTPTVGLKGVFVYVSASPDVYFQRDRYLWVGAAPLLSLTLVGVLLVFFLPPSLILFDVLFVAMNAAGSAGDLVLILMLLRYPSSSLIRDLGSGMVIYGLGAP